MRQVSLHLLLKPLRVPDVDLPPERDTLTSEANLYDQLRAKGYSDEDAARVAKVARVAGVPYDDPYETWFVTFPQPDPRADGWVRVEAPSKDEARAFAVHRYPGTMWELTADVEFNPDLYPEGELGAFRVEHRTPE